MLPEDTVKSDYWRLIAHIEKTGGDADEFFIKNLQTKERFEAWKKAAERGKPEGQYLLGECHRLVSNDKEEAAKWYLKAAEQGLSRAQFKIALCYIVGVGVPKNESEGLKWLRKAAERGVADAQFMLGVCYAGGAGVPKSESEAVEWYRKAAAKGHKPAIDMLEELGMDATSARTTEEQFTAAEQSQIDKFLAKINGNIRAVRPDGSTTLHVALLQGEPAVVVRFLISKGVGINAKDGGGITPLHLVVERGNVELARLLVSNGANVNAKDGVKDGVGETPLDYAKGSGNKAMIQYLTSVGGK
jgi:hypothetical protein